MPDYVFGYGSLAAPSGEALGFVPGRTRRGEGFVTELVGIRRGWGVAMDNRADHPGYKCYLDERGARPPVYVCFLDIAPAPGASVNGVCLPVSDAELAALDRRERNYDRVEVSAWVGAELGRGLGAELGRGLGPELGRRLGPEPGPQLGPGERVWAYRGSPAGRGRFRAGVAAGTAVIHAGYLEAVRAAFRRLGAAEWEACAPSLAPGELSVRALVRRELP